MRRGGRSRRSPVPVLVGHSFSGMIVSEVGVDPKVTALGASPHGRPMPARSYTALARNYPTPPATSGIVFGGDQGRF